MKKEDFSSFIKAAMDWNSQHGFEKLKKECFSVSMSLFYFAAIML